MFTRRPLTDEHKRKLSAALKGRSKSAATRANMSAGQRGRVHSQETRDRISASMLGKTQGVPKSTTHRANMSKAQLKRWAELTPEKREAWIESAQHKGGYDSKPQLAFVARLQELDVLVERFRIDGLKPDAVLPELNVVLEWNGCWFHAHDCERGRGMKRGLAEIAHAADAQRYERFVLAGYEVIVVRQCDDQEQAAQHITARLRSAQ